jgi:hypothetical protein
MVIYRLTFSTTDLLKFAVGELDGYISYGLERPIAAETGILPFPTIKKMLVTPKQLKVNRKGRRNTN